MKKFRIIGIVASIICALIVAVILTTKTTTRSHSDAFGREETNDVFLVVNGIKKISLIDEAWIEPSRICFKGKQFSGNVFHGEGTNRTFTSCGVDLHTTSTCFYAVSPDQIRDEIYRVLEETTIKPQNQHTHSTTASGSSE